MKKRILSLFLILCMAVTLLPTAVFAEEATGTSSTGVTIYVDALNGNDGNENVGKSWKTAYKTVEKAVAAAVSGDTILLGEGNYSTYGNTSPKKSLTFVGAKSGKTEWYIGSPTPDQHLEGTEYNGDYSFDGCENITFQKIKFNVYQSTYKGFIRINNVELDECEINGMSTYWGYETTTFRKTVFNCPSDYALWYYTGHEMTFDGCTFNSTGKIVHAYREATAETPLVLNFKDCTVNNTSSNKAVLNIKDNNNDYIVNISGTNTVTVVNPNRITCSKLFQVEGWADNYNLSGGNSNGKKCRATVNIDGELVWKDGKMVSHAIDTAHDKYTDGYKDNAFTEPTYGEWTKNPDGSQSRKGTKTCEYCGHEVTFEETKEVDPIDWDVSKSIIAAACLNTKDHYSYLIGYSDGTVRPNGRITRAEVATIFFRLLTDDARQRNWSSENNFSDVSADKWYNNAVSTLCHMGVLGGYSDGTFRPNAPITRAEFAKIAVSFAQANGSAVYSYFTDVKTTDWFAPYVTAAKDSSLIEGYSDGSFKPENRITRAEACAIVNRVLGRKPSESHMKISGRIDWPDCTTADWFYEAIMEATNSHTYQMGKRVETWNDKLPQRDWAALENNWASAYTGKGGEVH